VIERNGVMPLLLAACPSFETPWQAYVSGPVYESDLLYIHLAEFARHLVDLKRREQTAEFPDVFAAVERLHLEGDPYVAEAATIGLLEGIQNIAGNTGVAPESFVRYLEPESSRWWRRLNDFWAGGRSQV
jgi:hypothetical protein